MKFSRQIWKLGTRISLWCIVRSRKVPADLIELISNILRLYAKFACQKCFIQDFWLFCKCTFLWPIVDNTFLVILKELYHARSRCSVSFNKWPNCNTADLLNRPSECDLYKKRINAIGLKDKINQRLMDSCKRIREPRMLVQSSNPRFTQCQMINCKIFCGLISKRVQ